jgi:hypothetical protein
MITLEFSRHGTFDRETLDQNLVHCRVEVPPCSQFLEGSGPCDRHKIKRDPVLEKGLPLVTQKRPRWQMMAYEESP